jgi:succinate dehydrogenase hydrophobic anchor subunit
VKFLRRLIAVVLVVAVVVGLGMLWAHVSGGGTGSGVALRRAPSREALLRLEQIRAGAIMVHSDNGLNLADTGDLIRTCEIEAALAAIVITVSAVRRRHRRMRRTAG